MRLVYFITAALIVIEIFLWAALPQVGLWVVLGSITSATVGAALVDEAWRKRIRERERMDRSFARARRA